MLHQIVVHKNGEIQWAKKPDKPKKQMKREGQEEECRRGGKTKEFLLVAIKWFSLNQYISFACAPKSFVFLFVVKGNWIPKKIIQIIKQQ